MKALVVLLLAACGCRAEVVRNVEATDVYRIRARGMIDLFCSNPHAKRCSARTHDFRDAYTLEGDVQAIESVDVSSDAVVLHTAGVAVPATELVNDAGRIRAFWRNTDWTVVIVIDRQCFGDRCPAEISLIKYNGATTPSDQSVRTCFERWAGALTREHRVGR